MVCVLSPLLFKVYIRFSTLRQADKSHPTCEDISLGRKTHFASNEKILGVFTKNVLIWQNSTYVEKITLRKMSDPRTVVQ